jgi:DNA-binding NarL/FixJ family response regulator
MERKPTKNPPIANKAEGKLRHEFLPGRRIRTLIADNHAVLVDSMRAFVKPLRDVEVVGSTVDAIEAVDLAVKLRPDVAIVAINVLGMNGIEMTRQIRKFAPDTRILILSMHALPEYVYQAFRAGAHGYVVKEARAVEVIEAVRRISKGKRYMSDAVSNLIMGDIAAERSGANDPLSLLTERELDVLRLTAGGKSSAASAKFLGLSPKTVETYRSRIMRKLEIRDITSLVKFAIRHGIASLDS